MGSFSPLVFTGVSKFSEDFQTIIDRSVKIARLPATALENQQKDIVQQKVLVSNLSSTVDSLATAVKNLGTIASKKALGASSTDTDKVTATNVSAAAPARYAITDITSIARQAAETSVSGYTDSSTSAVSSTGSLKLVVGSEEYNLNIASSNNLTTLRNAINSLGAGVTASVLTTGTGANPYYLSITADTPGATTLQLLDDPSGTNTNLLTAANQGANTEFKINGVAVSKPSTTINDVVPGVVFSIKDTTASGEEVAVTLASDRSQLATALDGFVRAYNDTLDQVTAQMGESAGLLSGDFLVREVRGQLQKLAGYTGSGGGIDTLAEMGISFDNNGKVSLDSDVLDNLSATELQEAFEYFGDTRSGFGGLSQGLTAISDPFSGLAQIQIQQYDDANARITDKLTDINNRVTDMQKSMASRLQVMDTLLASLTSQQNTLTASIDSLNYSLYGKQTG